MLYLSNRERLGFFSFMCIKGLVNVELVAKNSVEGDLKN